MRWVVCVIGVSLFSQVAPWQYKQLLLNEHAHWSYPSVVVDSNGVIHLLLWDKHQDVLRYGIFASGQWQWQTLNIKGGYPNALHIGEDGNLYAAFLRNVNGRTQPCWAYYDTTAQQWQIEIIDTTLFGYYGEEERFYKYNIQATIKTYVDKNGIPYVVFFDDFYDDSRFLFGFQPIVYRKVAGQWERYNLFSLPLFAPTSTPNIYGTEAQFDFSDRYGEFACWIPFSDTLRFVTTAVFNGMLVFVEHPLNAPWSSWSVRYVDSVMRVVPLAASDDAWRAILMFESIDAKQSNDSLWHIVYSCSERYGKYTSTASSAWSISYMRYDPRVDTFFIQYIIPPPSTSYFSNLRLALKGRDTLVVTFTAREQNAYQIAVSFDKGNTWKVQTLYGTPAPVVPAPVAIVNDTLHVFLQDAQTGDFIHAIKPIDTANTTWQLYKFYQNTAMGSLLRWDYFPSGDTLYPYFFHTDPYRKRIFLSQPHPTLDTLQHQEIDDSLKHYFSLSLSVMDSQQLVLGYIDGVTQYPKMAWYKGGGNWIKEVIDFSSTATEVAITVDSSGVVHAAYVEGINQRLRYARRDNIGWVYEVIDDQGIRAGDGVKILIHNQIPYVVYQRRISGDTAIACFAYRPQPNQWIIDTIPLPQKNVDKYFALSFHNDTALIAIRTWDNEIYIAKYFNNNWQIEQLPFIPLGTLGKAMNLYQDSLGNLWLCYSIASSAPTIGLSVKTQNQWQQIFVFNPDNLSETMQMVLYKDRLYIAGHFNNLANSGIGWLTAPLDELFQPIGSSTISQMGIRYFRCYPNPFQESFWIAYNGVAPPEVYLYNLNGKKIPIDLLQTKHKLKVTPKIPLSKGYYVLVLKKRQLYWQCILIKK